jgi:hypothetical protein
MQKIETKTKMIMNEATLVAFCMPARLIAMIITIRIREINLVE